MNKQKKIVPVHPGEVLKEEFLIPKEISQSQLARGLNVSLKRVNEICQGKRSITPDTAYRLGIYFNLGESGTKFWMNLQNNYEINCWEDYLQQKGDNIKREVHPFKETRLSV